MGREGALSEEEGIQGGWWMWGGREGALSEEKGMQGGWWM